MCSKYHFSKRLFIHKNWLTQKRSYCIPNDGITLIEMLIALTLSTIIFSILLSLFISLLRSTTENAKYYQEITSINLLFSTLKKQIITAKNLGCRSSKIDVLTHIKEIDFKGGFAVNNNTLMIRFPEYSNIKILNTDSTNLITVQYQRNQDKNIKEGDVIILNDCQKAEIVKVKDTEKRGLKQRLTLTAPLRHHFLSSAKIGWIKVNEFYIKDKSSGKSLYVKLHNHEAHEIITDIDYLHFKKINSNTLMVKLSFNFLKPTNEWLFVF